MIILGVRTFASKAYLNLVIIDHFLVIFLVIYSPNKYSESRTNLKLSDNSIIYNGLTKKKKPFQKRRQQQKNEN